MQRNTQQRDAIRKVLQDANRPLSAQELLEAAQRHIPDLGLATIYRTLSSLCSEGYLAPLELPGSAIRYEVAKGEERCHFLCRTCNRMLKLPASPDSFPVRAPKGFVVERQELTLFGQCADCRKPALRPAKKRKPSARKTAPRKVRSRTRN
ncbi:MAG: transcriptional repressor [Kiritimatiellae bacterium]|nr:transcriptional repressor [Kiritimatiellia bacterium]MCO5068910.1 transcriptional repressor [Kiritimatiellia bacterium]